MTRTECSVAEFRESMADYTNRVRYAGERFVITRRGRPLIAVISLKDLEKLEESEET